MADILIEDIIDIVRGVIVDETGSGITTMFSNDDIGTAINLAKSTLFRDKPLAFTFSTSTDSSNHNNIDLPSLSEPSNINIPLSGAPTIAMEQWAKMALVYKTSAILVAQKSKDSYYRDIADDLERKYRENL